MAAAPPASIQYIDAPIDAIGSARVLPNGDRVATCEFRRTSVQPVAGPEGLRLEARSVTDNLTFTTKARPSKLGLLMVGIGGNNGTTTVAALAAWRRRRDLSWKTRDGIHRPDWLGSLTQSSTVKLGDGPDGPIYVPFKRLVDLVEPEDIVVGGWDISAMPLGAAMERSRVLPIDLQRQLRAELDETAPWPAAFDPDYVASTMQERADNVIPGTRREQLATIRADIRRFAAENGLGGEGAGPAVADDQPLSNLLAAVQPNRARPDVVVMWTASTERLAEVKPATHGSAVAVLDAIDRNDPDISPSVLYAVASALEGVSFINGSPQNTLLDGVVELAQLCGVHVGGDDFKSGQTKMKSVLVDFLVQAGIRVECIASYNHLGNGDGRNLAEAAQFRSKEVSKTNVIDDCVASNGLLYPRGATGQAAEAPAAAAAGTTPTTLPFAADRTAEARSPPATPRGPDHCVVIKYLPFVGDSKRAMDEYSSSLMLGGRHTLVLHNTCEDSLLACPLILDLVLLCNALSRIDVRQDGEAAEEQAGSAAGHPVLSLLGYCLKAPMARPGEPVINALGQQRRALVDFLRLAAGLPLSTALMPSAIRA